MRLVPKDINLSKDVWLNRNISIDTLDGSTKTDAIASKVMKFQNGKKVEMIEDELKQDPSSKKDYPTRSIPSTIPNTTNKDLLWPLFFFDVKNRIVLDSAVSILFDTIDANHDEDTKVYSF